MWRDSQRLDAPLDLPLAAAARALARGDPLGALGRVALREDAPSLALRGIAMAQLGEFGRARLLLRRAARAFGAQAPLARARCVVAEAEIALASRDLAWPVKSLDAARDVLERHGDRLNAAHARHLVARRLLLIGRIDEAAHALEASDSDRLPPALHAVRDLLVAGIALRRLATSTARAAFGRARRAAREAGIAALTAEVENAAAVLKAPAARLVARGEARLLLLDEVEALLASERLVVDGCRYAVRIGATIVPLATRPVLFALLRELGEAWPADVPRETLMARVFRTRHPDDSHRARLRVELGRLRAALKPLAAVSATRDGYALAPHDAREVVVLAQPSDERHASVLALLADGEAWSSSALALALGASQRSVQRALEALAAAHKVCALGEGRARRWTTPPTPGFATTLLLPVALADLHDGGSG